MRKQEIRRIEIAHARGVHTRHHLRAISTGKLSQPIMSRRKKRKVNKSREERMAQVLHGVHACVNQMLQGQNMCARVVCH